MSVGDGKKVRQSQMGVGCEESCSDWIACEIPYNQRLLDNV